MYIMIKVINNRKDGSLYHYAHFIMDCLFNEILLDFDKYKKIYRKKNLKQTIGNFKNIYESILNVENIEIPDHEFDKLEVQLIQTYRIDSPTKDQIDKFKNYIFNKLNINQIENIHTYPEIILIKRGDHRDLIDDPELKKINKNITTGKERREINNIDKLQTFLECKYPKNVSTLVLENMPFIDQVRVFNNAKLIIGIHGAGLANVLFCKPNTILIEVNAYFRWDFLNNCCKVGNIKHIICDNNYDAIRRPINSINV
jgi:hypothetical protein